MSLKEYARKRDFARTAEPGPKLGRSGATHRFVIQKHQASRLHYDFRLEIDGTLKSWAVPKGVPFVKGEKRLAMQVEDHPVGYIDFEGTIPKGQYGGGTVMVWDTGTFEVVGAQDLAKGKLHFLLHGKKLVGEWYLVQMRGGTEWLLIRGGDSMKPVSKRRDDTSALSGKTMAQLGKSGRVWNSQHSGAPAAKVGTRRRLHGAPPKFIEPMKARLVSVMPEGDDWVYEVKFDGFRALAFKAGADVRLFSRNEKDLGGKFPEIIRAVSALPISDCILDGEVVALNKKGLSSFQLLQSFESGEESSPLFYYAFDLLGLDGRDLRGRPLEERKECLEQVLRKAPLPIRYSASLEGSAKALLKKAGQLGLEGLIGKRRGSVYEPGARSGAWIKLKLSRQQEMVIGGYSDPDGSRKHFGALLIGYYSRGRLTFAGKVGTGFDDTALKRLHRQFGEIRQEGCPFVNLPEKRSSRHGQAITASQMKRCHWLQPVLVCQVRFAEWTRDGKLRQPVFLGIREDKEATEVVREKPA